MTLQFSPSLTAYAFTSPAKRAIDALRGYDPALSKSLYHGQTLVDYDESFEGGLYITPQIENRVHFLYSVQHGLERDGWKQFEIPPTQVSFKEEEEGQPSETISCWALDFPELPEAVQAVAKVLGMTSLNEPIPLPDTDGFELVHCDAGISTTLEKMQAAYIPDDLDAAEAAISRGSVLPPMKATPSPSDCDFERLILGKGYNASANLRQNGGPFKCGAKLEDPFYLSPTSTIGVHFFFVITDNVNDWRKCPVPPIAVLRRGADYILVFALNTFWIYDFEKWDFDKARWKEEAEFDKNTCTKKEAQDIADELGMCFEDLLPCPGTDGWDLVHTAPGRYTNVAEMRAAFVGTNYFPSIESFLKRVSAKPAKKGKSTLADKIRGEDAARRLYKKAIEALTPNSSDEEVTDAIKLVLEANLPAMVHAKTQELIAAKTASKITPVRKQFGALMRSMLRSAVGGLKVVPNGPAIFSYHGEFDFHEAAGAFVAVIKAHNEREKMPIVSVMGMQPMRLSYDTEGRPQFSQFNRTGFWSHGTGKLAFVRPTEDGDGTRGKVPEEVATHVYEEAYAHFRQSPTVTYAPMFLSGGNLLDKPGYHYSEEDPARLNHLYVPASDLVVPTIPDSPTKEQAEASRDWIRNELLSDFPFFDIDSVTGDVTRSPSEAHAFAMLITPFIRPMIKGRTPVFFIRKPKGGTGGTLLSELSMRLFDGKVATSTRYSANDEEMNKALLTDAETNTGGHLHFDNVVDFSNIELLRNITSETIGGRRLGSNSKIEVPNRFNWIANGNNPRIDDQMERRVIFINLNARTSNIQTRKFRHSKYTEFVIANRSLAISHLLTMIKFWIVSKKKAPFTARNRVGFEGWCETVGGVLQACGIEGFLDQAATISVSSEQGIDAAFVQAWFNMYGGNSPQKVGDLFAWADGQGLDIVSGKFEEIKKGRFTSDLQRLDGNTFSLVGANNVRADYMVRSTTTPDSLIAYQLIPVEESK